LTPGKIKKWQKVQSLLPKASGDEEQSFLTLAPGDCDVLRPDGAQARRREDVGPGPEDVCRIP